MCVRVQRLAHAPNRARAQQAIFDDDDAGWDLAEDWLSRWESWAPPQARDPRSWWLRRYWRGVEREAAAASAMPWRDPQG